MRFAPLSVSLSLLLSVSAIAQPLAVTPTPVPTPKRIPIPGITLTDTDRTELTAGAAALRAEIDALKPSDPKLAALLPDVEVFHKAVDWALRYDEIMAPKDIAYARTLLAKGRERAAQLREGKAPWLDARGTILRGYRSKLDGSVQPYALLVPESWPRQHRQALVWLLGRGEKRTELTFFSEREGGQPQIAPKDTLVVMPYGRFCNATKFAGEVDVFEVLDAAKAQYQLDENRIAVAGFSMGGGSTWHIASHYPHLWAVSSPGAGFAETPIFTKSLDPKKEQRPAWEQLLWRQFDATGIAANFSTHPTLAYAGELDGQKEASDLMEKAFATNGLKLERFIGPQTAHKYHDATKAEITKRIEEQLAKGREPQPREVRFSTYTLRYPDSHGFRIEGMEKHWERAEVSITGLYSKEATLTTRNVSALTFTQPTPALVIDGQRLEAGDPKHEARTVVRKDGRWSNGSSDFDNARSKRPGLTGPINDAFYEPFIFVRPTGKALHPEVGAWAESELTAARNLWRDVYRGDVRIKSDKEITDADIAAHNLVLWGDPSSNALLKRILAQLPLTWDAKALVFRGQTYDPKTHAPILI
ncbi:MAG TPA: prolyl oligopeptidase family serine peptidase, partial [Opitutaceae bacterium]